MGTAFLSTETKRRLIIATLAFIVGAKACPETHTVISKQPTDPVVCIPTPCKPVPCYDPPPEARRVLTEGYDCECWEDFAGALNCDCGG